MQGEQRAGRLDPVAIQAVLAAKGAPGTTRRAGSRRRQPHPRFWRPVAPRIARNAERRVPGDAPFGSGSLAGQSRSGPREMPREASQGSGSILSTPFSQTSKWQCGPVEKPRLPTVAI